MLTEKYDTLSAFFPNYTDSGDVTKVFFKTGKAVEVSQKTTSFLNKVASFYSMDVKALRRRSAKRTGKKNMLPLPFSSLLLLVPVKVRNIRVDGDYTLGYVNKYAVKQIQSTAQAPYATDILLTGNHHVLSLWPVKTVKKAMRQATLSIFANQEDGQIAGLAQRLIELLRELHNL